MSNMASKFKPLYTGLNLELYPVYFNYIAFLYPVYFMLFS
jgi:hypothetical protein